MKIYDLSNIPEEILDKVGGKAKGLYLLNKFSFNVPKGFILIDMAEENDFLDEKVNEFLKEWRNEENLI